MLGALGGILAAGGSRPGFKETIPSTRELFDWPCLVDLKLGGLNMCINRTVVLEFVVAALVAIFFIVAFRRPRVVPRGMQNVMEAVYDFTGRDVIEMAIGSRGVVWQPYLMVLFLFTFLVSIIEVVPAVQFPLSSRIAVPMFLAIGSWLVYNYAGIREKGFIGYFREVMFPAGVPVPAYIILTPIELATALLIRPFTLAIRLFANLFAGHLFLVVLFLGAAYLIDLPLTIPFALGAIAMSVLIVGLEIFVAAVQAYVFTILTAVYIQLATSHEH